MTTIAIMASGTRGDVQPYVALGAGLKAAGYEVRVLTTDDFEGLVTGAGLEFRSVGSSIEAMMQSAEWQRVIEGGSFLRILSRMMGEMKARAQSLAANIPLHFDGVDGIVAGAGGSAASISEHLRLPLVQAYVFPLTPTRAFASPLTPSLPFGALLNPLSFHVTRQMLWQSGRAADVAVRQTLGMPKGSFFGPYRALKQRRVPVLYGYSRHVLPRPDDWDDLNQVTGYWFLPSEAGWTPPADLVDFLSAGEPPVYIGFGSMGNRDPEATTRLTLEALTRSGRRGVLASGWGGMHAQDLPDTVYMLKSAPHSWLFPQMAAVVHHGGAGTTAAGLSAGIPSIIVPFFGDQPFWGGRVAMLGVGTAPIPRRRLTADKLAAAITQATADRAMQQRAAALGQRIRDEDGIGQAVALIGQRMGSPRRSSVLV